ncbi:MAG: HAD family hydrolase [Balneolaceae bacterium]
MMDPAIKEDLANRFRALSAPMKREPTGETPVLKKLPNIRAVIFDFYGTLFISGVGDIGVDDGASDTELMLKALRATGVEILSNKAGKRAFELYKKYVTAEQQTLKASGIPYPEPDLRIVWRNVLNQLLAEENISTATTNHHHVRMAVEFEARMNPIWPMPDARETLQALSAKRLELGIISNSQFYTPVALEALLGETMEELGFNRRLLHWSFEESRKKPSLPFYQSFAEKAQQMEPSIVPEQILFAGNDMLKDVWPAAKTGFKTALFAGDNRSLKWRRDDPRCTELQPDLVITELKQLVECV